MTDTMNPTRNIFDDLPASSMEEDISILFERPGAMIERIVSTGQASPPGFWYDQDWTEWVVLLAGAARLRFEDEAEDRVFAPGDHALIAPRRRHRIEWTQSEPPTLWLAVHIREESAALASGAKQSAS
jgi:cupin 2 domain-containing protein